MAEFFKEYVKKILTSRLFVLSVVMILLFSSLIHRIFVLQIINGKEYLDNYTLWIQKERITSGTRGSIFDRNGKLLAFNELSYSVTIEDNGVYDSTKQKNQMLNQELSTLIRMIEKKGDTIAIGTKNRQIHFSGQNDKNADAGQEDVKNDDIKNDKNE